MTKLFRQSLLKSLVIFFILAISTYGSAESFDSLFSQSKKYYFADSINMPSIANEAISMFQAELDDSAKLRSLYYYLVYHYYYHSIYDSAKIWHAQLAHIDSLLNIPEKICQNCMLIGDIEYYLGNYNNSIKAFEDGLEIANNLQNDSLRYKCLLGISFSKHYLGELIESEELLLEILNDSSAQKYPTLLSNAHNLLGILQSDRGELTKAIDNYQTALNIELNNKNSNGAATLYNNIAVLYISLKNFDKALEYLDQSKSIYEKTSKSNYYLADYNINLGTLYQEQEKYDKAVECYQKSLDIYRKYNDRSGILLSYTNLCDVYINIHEFAAANNYLLKAEDMALEISDSITLMYIYNSRGKLFSIEGNSKKAEYFIRKSLRMANEYSNTEMIEANYKSLFEHYKRIKKYDIALSYYKSYRDIQDSIRGNIVQKQLYSLNALYENEREKHEIEKLKSNQKAHELELAQQKTKIRNQKWFLHVALTLIVIFLTAIFIIIKNIYQKRNLLIISNKRNTDLVKSKKALIESEEKFRLLAENTPAVIYMCKNNITFSMIYLNPYIKVLTGYEPEHFYSSDEAFVELIHPDDIDYVQSKQNHGGNYKLIYRLKHLKGHYIWIEEYGSILQDEGHESGLLEGFIHDITDRKKAEEETQKARLKAEESERIKNNFIANMSHELRTPLNALLGFAEILEMDAPNKDYQEMAHIVLSSGNRLLETLNMILDLTMIESQQVSIRFAACNINEILDEKIKLYYGMADKKNIHLYTECPAEPFLLQTDPLLLAKILDNLINNAIKYTNFGFVKVGFREENGIEGNYLSLFVEDTGIGIKREALNQIFEKFRQASEGTNREFEGTGLGLSLTQEYVGLLGGSIYVQSEVDKGSVFSIRLPIDQNENISIWQKPIIASHLQNPAPQKPAVIETKNEEKKLKNINVLLVEDDMHNSRFSLFSLENICSPDAVANGPQAVEACKKKTYDIVLMDINLGVDMNGIQAMKTIKTIEGFENCIFAAITANVMSNQKQLLLDEGFEHYLAKPFRSIELQNLVQEMAASILKD